MNRKQIVSTSTLIETKKISSTLFNLNFPPKKNLMFVCVSHNLKWDKPTQKSSQKRVPESRSFRHIRGQMGIPNRL